MQESNVKEAHKFGSQSGEDFAASSFLGEEVDTEARRARLIAFYLPQFHPTRENDEWWGKGFTEWTNVTKARPLFSGHHQPNLPADLGFYDLRIPEVRQTQADLARNAGIEGFCYWHYWFDGRRILERPFEEVLQSGEPDFPFCLGWANESWQGIWHGCEKRLLIEQSYPGAGDHERHFYSLLPAFQDRRYIRVGGCPLFMVYRPHNLPEPEKFTDQWQDLARMNGLPGIHFVAHLFDNETEYPYRQHGYDAALMASALKVASYRYWNVIQRRWKMRDTGEQVSAVGVAFGAAKLAWRRLAQRIMRWPGAIYDYDDAKRFFDVDLAVEKGMYPSVVPNWDNSPRAGKKGVILHQSTPDKFALHLEQAVETVQKVDSERRIIFVKSWNEWAEGNYLEPDQRWGHAYLDAVRRAVVVGGDV